MVGPANISLTFDDGHATSVIGPGHHCKAPVQALATIIVPTGAGAPTGNVTFAITNAHAPVSPTQLTLKKVEAPHLGMLSYASEPSIAAFQAQNMASIVMSMLAAFQACLTAPSS